MLGGVENGASGQNDRLFLPEGTFTVTPSGQFLEEGTQPGEGNSKLGAGPAVCPQTTVEAEKAVMGVSWRAVQGGQGRQTAKDGEIGFIKAATRPETDLSDTPRPAGLGTRRSPHRRQAVPVTGDTD